jgi:hypothetical protein
VERLLFLTLDLVRSKTRACAVNGKMTDDDIKA